MKRQFLSPTKISMYAKCPYQYYCRYVLFLKRPPGAALTFGGSFDVGINENYRHKEVKRKDLPVKQVKELFSAAWEEKKGNTLFLPDEKPGEIKDIGIKCVDVFHKEICKKVQPVKGSVQKKIVIPFPNVDYDILGYLDVTDEKTGERVDNKTAGRSWPEDRPLKEIQPIIYTLGDKGVSHFRYDIAVKTKVPKTQQLKRVVTPVEKAGILRYIAHVKDAIDNEIFFPRREHTMCSHRFCGYAELCEKEFGWTIPSGIKKKVMIVKTKGVKHEKRNRRKGTGSA